MEAIVLAGGLGTRLGEKTKNVPKAMLFVGERPFLELLLDYWAGQGVSRFILSVGHKHEAIQKHFGRKYGNCDIDYSVEEKLLGTGGGILLAQNRLKQTDPFLALNGDTFFEVPLQDFKQFHEARKAECSLALFEVATRDRYEGVQIGSDGRIQKFVTRDGVEPCQFANGGVYLANRTWAETYKCEKDEVVSIERDLFPERVEQKVPLYGFVSQGRFIDIGTPSDYERCKDMLAGEKK